MKITKVEAFPVSFPLDVPARDATGVWDSWNTVIVKITASDGTTGYGEIGPIHGGGIPIFKAMVDHKLSRDDPGGKPLRPGATVRQAPRPRNELIRPRTERGHRDRRGRNRYCPLGPSSGITSKPRSTTCSGAV